MMFRLNFGGHLVTPIKLTNRHNNQSTAELKVIFQPENAATYCGNSLLFRTMAAPPLLQQQKDSRSGTETVNNASTLG